MAKVDDGTVVIYTTTSCSSCRKAVAWLKANSVPFFEVSLNVHQITETELMHIIGLTESGIKDIISTRSDAFKRLTRYTDEISVQDLAKAVWDDPTMLKRPLLVTKNKLQIGYSDIDIRKFVPREARRKSLDELLRAEDAQI
ncbi:Spx/MgsR family RNA polymerase-binding regulatory protein [Weissella muntiaci]|nr:Spx/MgsR family RNA polymerase-binding regulatory protein [Weissella muntiaci]